MFAQGDGRTANRGMRVIGRANHDGIEFALAIEQAAKVMRPPGAREFFVSAGAAFLIYRAVRKPAMAERLRGMMPNALGELPDSVREKLKRRPVRVVISTAEDRERAWESVARKMAPMIATSVATAVASRIARPAPGTGKKSEA